MTTNIWAMLMSIHPLALGLKYELAEVTAIKINIRVATALPLPRRATAASGKTRPAVTSDSDILVGKVGKTGLDSKAKAERPIVVAVS